jgi:hypothetical protein
MSVVINRLADEITKADHHRLELAGGLHAQTNAMSRFSQQLKATQEVMTARNKAFKAYSRYTFAIINHNHCSIRTHVHGFV